ncbi:MAG: DegV family protein [Ruminococcus sp.]|nr:DegV family protein [Ruminococcus sp.]
MEEKIIITCDSSIDLSPELVKEYNIKILPVNVRMDDKEYLDIEEITPDDILAYHDNSEDLATTAAPSIQQAFRFFTRFVHMGYTVIHFALSSGLSSAYSNAIAAAESFQKVTVIDSKTASVAGGLLVIVAAEMLQEGKSSKEIIQESRSIVERLQEPFLLDDIQILYKGGRISALSSFIGGLLKVKPSLYVQNSDGTLHGGKQYKGKFENAAPKFIHDSVGAGGNMNKKHLMIGHTGLSDAFLEDCKNQIQQLTNFEQIHIIRAGSTITSHLGRNALILAWYTKT